MITDKEIEEYIGIPFSGIAAYYTNIIRKAAKAAYYKGAVDATNQWAWWKDGTQYVGSCGKTLAQALDLIAEESEE